MGPKVDPETHGIWGWVDRNSKLAGGRTVVVLDTEGFFTSNSSDLYDAKLFSITSLVSSVLIYNTIKIIDTTQIDYLEFLAKRTQLFSLKKSILSDENYQDLDFISFPPLCKNSYCYLIIIIFCFCSDWVVRDFVQDLRGESATEWLKRNVRERGNKEVSGVVIDESEQAEFSLTTLFSDLECFTLFYPSTDPDALRDLNSVDVAHLTSEWTDGVNELRRSISGKITNGAKPKVSSGAELMNYLNVLVDLSQTNRFPEVPSVWKSYVERLVTSSLTAAKDYFYNMVKENTMNNIYTDDEFEHMYTEVEDLTKEHFINMLFGLEYVYAPHLEKLTDYIRNEKSNFHDENANNVGLFCVNETNTIREAANDLFVKILLPIPENELQQKIENIIVESTALHREKLGKYIELYAKCKEQSTSFTTSLINKKNEIINENRESQKKFVDNAIKKALIEYTMLMDDVVSRAVLPNITEFQKDHINAEASAEASLERALKGIDISFLESSPQKDCKEDLKKQIDDKYTKLCSKYNKKVTELGNKAKNDAVVVYRNIMRIVSTDGPFKKDDFIQLDKGAKEMACNSFMIRMDPYYNEDSKVCSDLLKSLNRTLRDTEEHYMNVNDNRAQEMGRKKLTEVLTQIQSYSKAHPYSSVKDFAMEKASEVFIGMDFDPEHSKDIAEKWYRVTYNKDKPSRTAGPTYNTHTTTEIEEQNSSIFSGISLFDVVVLGLLLMVVILKYCF